MAVFFVRPASRIAAALLQPPDVPARHPRQSIAARPRSSDRDEASVKSFRHAIKKLLARIVSLLLGRVLRDLEPDRDGIKDGRG